MRDYKMADIGILIKTVEEFITNPSKEEEDYVEEEEHYEYGYYCKDETENSMTSYIISMILFVVAAYISYGCNSISYPEMGDFEKLSRAFFAGIFGFFYIILYVVFWSSDCNKAYITRARGGKF